MGPSNVGNHAKISRSNIKFVCCSFERHVVSSELRADSRASESPLPWGCGRLNQKWSRGPLLPPSAGAQVKPVTRTAGVFRGSGSRTSPCCGQPVHMSRGVWP